MLKDKGVPIVLRGKYTGILLSRRKFLILVPFKHKLGSFKLVTLHLYLLLEPGAPVVFKIKVNIF